VKRFVSGRAGAAAAVVAEECSWLSQRAAARMAPRCMDFAGLKLHLDVSHLEIPLLNFSKTRERTSEEVGTAKGTGKAWEGASRLSTRDRGATYQRQGAVSGVAAGHRGTAADLWRRVVRLTQHDWDRARSRKLVRAVVRSLVAAASPRGALANKLVVPDVTIQVAAGGVVVARRRHLLQKAPDERRSDTLIGSSSF